MKQDKNRPTATKHQSHATGGRAQIPPLLFGALLFLACFTVSLFVFSFILLQTKDPLPLIPYVSIGVMLFCALLSAVIFAKHVGKNGLFCGLLIGGVFSVLIVLLSVTVGAGPQVQVGHRILWLLIAVAAATIGGLLGGRSDKKKENAQSKLKKLRK